MQNELITKAKECRNAEELLALAKENGFEMSAEEAAARLAELHNEGELSEDELSNATGGGCEISVNGEKKVRVTRGCRCFTGQYESIMTGFGYNDRERTDVEFEPRPENFLMFSAEGACAMCIHCGFADGYAYCKKT